MMMMRTLLVVLLGLTLFTGPANAEAQEVGSAEQEMGEGGEEDLAKKAQNPLANIISMPLQWNTDFGIGPDDETGYVLNIQPIYPVSLKNGATLINRMILPLPKSVPGVDRETGMGDLTLMNWYSPEPKGAFMWGLGPVTLWPTATDKALGDDKFSIGPSAVLVLTNRKFLAAVVINAWWSVAGDSDAPDVGVFYMQPIFNYFLPNKWYVGTAPVIIKDLEGASGEKWLVPVGGGFGKLFNVGKLPADGVLHFYKYVEAPDAGPDWQVRLQFKLIFPKK